MILICSPVQLVNAYFIILIYSAMYFILCTGVCNCLGYGRFIIDGTKGTNRNVAYLRTLSYVTNVSLFSSLMSLNLL